MLESTLSSFSKNLNFCKNCADKSITCGQCKLIYYLKCKKRTYAPTKKIWKRNDYSNKLIFIYNFLISFYFNFL